MISYHFFETLPSTQLYAKDHLNEFDLSKIVCIYAKEQTSGIGTHGRKWFSPSTQNIYASFVFSIPMQLKHFNNLSQILSLSVSTILKSYKFCPKLRWPNDIILSEKKVGGVLCDILGDVGILGLGLNVNMNKEDLELVGQPATSLLVEGENPPPFEELLCKIGDQLLVDLERYFQEGFTPFFETYSSLMSYIGAPIHTTLKGKSIRGLVESVHPDGRLNIKLPDGKTLTISSGSIGC